MESGMELFAPDAGELVQDLAGRAFEVEAEGAEAEVAEIDAVVEGLSRAGVDEAGGP